MADPKLEAQAATVLTLLTRLIRTMKMYSANHPAVKNEIDLLAKNVASALAMTEMLSIGQKEGELILQGQPVKRSIPSAERVLEALAEKNIDSFQLYRGVSREELDKFARLLALRPEEALAGGNLKPAVTEGLQKIHLNQLEYIAVRKGEADKIGKTDYGEGGMEGWLGRTFDDEMKGAGQVGGGSIASIMMSLFSKMAPEFEHMEDKDQAAEYAKQYFGRASDQLVTQFHSSLKDLTENLRKSVAQFAPNVQKDLFGRVFRSEDEVQIDRILQGLPPEVKAQLVINEMQGGTVDPKQLDGRIKTLMTADGDIVSLAEQISKRLVSTGQTEEESREYLSRLWKLVQSGRRIEDLEEEYLGIIVIADAEEELVRDYKTVLERAGYRCLWFKNGPEALKAVRERDPDVLVMDIKLPGKNGIEIISALDQERRHVPIVVVTAATQFRQTFEVQMYPKLAFLGKPFNFREFFESVEKMVPKRRPEKEKAAAGKAVAKGAAPAGAAAEGGQEDEEERSLVERDMKKAREVQAKLLPNQIPKIPGFDLCAYYNACKDIGGDYFDFINLPGGRIGIVIADVSGKAVSGAMVMVMARTLFRQIAPLIESPRETVVKVNSALAGDMRRGMFVTAYYMILDVDAQNITMCCAGHNPAVYWDEQNRVCTLTEPSGMAMGLIASASFGNTLREETIQFRKGDRLYLYTDGVVECMNDKEEEYGEKRLIQLLNRHATAKSHELVAATIQDLKAYQGDAPTHDDVTIVTLRSTRKV